MPVQPSAWTNPHIQGKLAVDTLNPLAIPAVACNVVQVITAHPKTPVGILFRQAYLPIGYLCVPRRELWLVAVTGLADLEREQASVIVIPCVPTTLCAISLLRDGFTAFFEEPPGRSQP